MKLYMRAQVEALALSTWHSEGALFDVKEKRREERLRKAEVKRKSKEERQAAERAAAEKASGTSMGTQRRTYEPVKCFIIVRPPDCWISS